MSLVGLWKNKTAWTRQSQLLKQFKKQIKLIRQFTAAFWLRIDIKMSERVTADFLGNRASQNLVQKIFRIPVRRRDMIAGRNIAEAGIQDHPMPTLSPWLSHQQGSNGRPCRRHIELFKHIEHDANRVPSSVQVRTDFRSCWTTASSPRQFEVERYHKRSALFSGQRLRWVVVGKVRHKEHVNQKVQWAARRIRQQVVAYITTDE